MRRKPIVFSLLILEGIYIAKYDFREEAAACMYTAWASVLLKCTPAVHPENRYGEFVTV